MSTPASVNLTGYNLTFDDEFNAFNSNGPAAWNSPATGTGTWDTTYSYGERALNDETELYSDPTIGVNPDSISGGVLDIHAAPSNPAQTNGQTYTSGVITTAHSYSQEYGYFEMRAELPQGAGFWPAFWLLPQVHTWPPELDVLEAFGATTASNEGGANSIHNEVITTDSSIGNQGGWNSTNGANIYTSYNTYGVSWTPTTITFYFNGTSYAVEPTPADFHQAMYLIANLAVGGHWPGNPTGESGDLKIDYIRAFSNDGSKPAVAQQTISSPDGGGQNFYGATDANGKQAAGGTTTPPVVVTPPPVVTPPSGPVILGSGPDTLALSVAEDAYNGDAQFTVSVDGVQIGATQTATALNSSGSTRQFQVMGSFGAGAHTASVNFLNDLYGGSSQTDRNLYVTGGTIDGAAVANSALTLLSSGTKSFTFQGAAVTAPVITPPVTPSAPVTLGQGADILALSMAEDAYNGDAQFTVKVDGVQIGGTQTTTASHAAGATQTFNVDGTFAAGPHTVAVNFLNDLYAGSAQTDRNLYVTGATNDGAAVASSALALLSSGSQSFTFQGAAVATPPVVPPTTTDKLVLGISEDAWAGDATYTVSIDGAKIGGERTATASHTAGATQTLELDGNWGAGPHTIGVTFDNDLYGGNSSSDRNLYVDTAKFDGTALAGAPTTLFGNGTSQFLVPAPSKSDTIGLHLSEDAYAGNAQFSVAVDGVQVGGTQSVTALHSLGNSQAFSFQDYLSAGSHDLSVTFLNDLYAGSPQTDRNLYMQSADLNGVALGGSSASLLSAGSFHVTFNAP